MSAGSAVIVSAVGGSSAVIISALNSGSALVASTASTDNVVADSTFSVDSILQSLRQKCWLTICVCNYSLICNCFLEYVLVL